VKLNFFQRRNIWWPTWKGWLLLFLILVAPVITWAWFGETFLMRTGRVAADTLVVESWIQPDGLHAAAAEYRSGGYRHLVITGGMTGSKGTLRRRSYITLARRELVDAGIAPDAITPAEMPDVDSQRTHAMALAVRRALEERDAAGGGECLHRRRTCPAQPPRLRKGLWTDGEGGGDFVDGVGSHRGPAVVDLE
jgi:hypothetical protein